MIIDTPPGAIARSLHPPPGFDFSDPIGQKRTGKPGPLYAGLKQFKAGLKYPPGRGLAHERVGQYPSPSPLFFVTFVAQLSGPPPLGRLIFSGFPAAHNIGPRSAMQTGIYIGIISLIPCFSGPNLHFFALFLQIFLCYFDLFFPIFFLLDPALDLSALISPPVVPVDPVPFPPEFPHLFPSPECAAMDAQLGSDLLHGPIAIICHLDSSVLVVR